MSMTKEFLEADMSVFFSYAIRIRWFLSIFKWKCYRFNFDGKMMLELGYRIRSISTRGHDCQRGNRRLTEAFKNLLLSITLSVFRIHFLWNNSYDYYS